MKQTRNLEKEVLNTIEYFSFFKYPPTFLEIHTFLKKKVTKEALTSILKEMMKKSLIMANFKFSTSLVGRQVPSLNRLPMSKYQTTNAKHLTSNINSLSRYTLPEYPIHFQTFMRRQKISTNKIKHIQVYMRVLTLFSQIRLVGLSGSTAMHNAEMDHDVDLFIITAKNRLFTGRFIALLLAEIIGIRRRRDKSYKLHVISYMNKVCLNLFFDESNLSIPKSKRSRYVAHELLQMKPLVQKGDIYRKLIDANRWVFDIFPNARNTVRGRTSAVEEERSDGKTAEVNVLANTIEFLLKNFQLYFIRRHKTTEIITNTQLWFHPDDFEKKMK